MTNNDILAARLERRLLLKLNHPNILNLEDNFEDANYFCLVTELMPHDLRETMAKVGDALDEGFCRQIFYRILQAVAFCHKNNVTHRDIKMENILLDFDMDQGGIKVKLCDFGSAQ